MFNLINKHPFISGFIAGVLTVGVVRKKLKNLVKGKITIVQIDIREHQEQEDTTKRADVNGDLIKSEENK